MKKYLVILVVLAEWTYAEKLGMYITSGGGIQMASHKISSTLQTRQEFGAPPVMHYVDYNDPRNSTSSQGQFSIGLGYEVPFLQNMVVGVELNGVYGSQDMHQEISLAHNPVNNVLVPVDVSPVTTDFIRYQFKKSFSGSLSFFIRLAQGLFQPYLKLGAVYSSFKIDSKWEHNPAFWSENPVAGGNDIGHIQESKRSKGLLGIRPAVGFTMNIPTAYQDITLSWGFEISMEYYPGKVSVHSPSWAWDAYGVESKVVSYSKPQFTNALLSIKVSF